MGLLAGVGPALSRRATERIWPAHLAAIRDWSDSSCQDPERHPSPAIAPNWSRQPGTVCGSCAHCRPEQRTPAGDWDTWLFLGGRGTGKTRSAAEDMAETAAQNLRWRIAILAPTYADARDTCVEGESGLLAVLNRWGWIDGRDYVWNRSLGELRLTKSRSQFKLFSAEKPARLRGPQHHRAWVDELAQVVRDAPDAWDMLQFGLRLGKRPQVVATTTPLPVTVIKELIQDPHCATTRGATDANTANLPAATLRKLNTKYGGKRLGRQELDAELLDDIPGALWRRAWLDDHRLDAEPVPGSHEVESVRLRRRVAALTALVDAGITLVRIVVAVDPAVTSKEDSDETGIIVAGLGDDGYVWVLEDASLRDTPATALDRVIECYDWWEANAVVLEINNGGEYIPELLASRLKLAGREPRSVVTDTLHAKKGKRVRAEAAAGLYEPDRRTNEPGRVRHVGTLAHYEDQICTWESKKTESPDRMDAGVYAVLYLEDSGDGSSILTPVATIARHQGGPGRIQIPTSSVSARR